MTTIQPYGPLLYQFKDGQPQHPVGRLGNGLSGIANMAFDFDARYPASLIKDTSNRVVLIADRSQRDSTKGYYTPADVALYCSGATGGYASVPDSTSLDASSQIELIGKYLPNLAVPATAVVLASKFTTAGNQRSYLLRIDTAGKLTLNLSQDGVSSTAATSSVAMTLANQETIHTKATWRASDGRVQFFTSPDGIAWTQLGTDLTIAIASIFNSTAVFEIGAREGGTADNYAGRVHQVIVRKTIGGANDLDVDFTAQAPGTTSFTCATGQVVTINSPALIGWFDGTNRLCINGTSGNGLYYAASTIGNGATELESIVRYSFNRFTAPDGIGQQLDGRYGSAANKRVWGFNVTNAKELGFFASSNGTTSYSATSSVLLDTVVPLYTPVWLKCDWRASDSRVRFWYSLQNVLNPADVTWIQFGTNSTLSTPVAALATNDTPRSIGYKNPDNTVYVDGQFYYASVATTIGGTHSGIVDAAVWPKLATSVASKIGEVWTIAASGASGARIQAPRDAYWATTAGQMLHVSEDSNGCYTTPELGISTSGVDRDCINSDGSTANRRAEFTPGTAGAFAGQAASFRDEFLVPTSNPGAVIQLGSFVLSATGGAAQAWSYNAAMNTAGALTISQIGASGADYRLLTYAGFRAAYSGTWVRIAVVHPTGNSSTAPTITANGVDITSSFALTTAGTPPNWMPASLDTTRFICGFNFPSGRFVPHAPILGALSNAEAVTWTSGGELPSWATVGSGLSNRYSSNFSAGADSAVGMPGCTVTGNTDGINGQDDWLKVERTSTTGTLGFSRIISPWTLATSQRVALKARVYNASATSKYITFGFAGYVSDVSGGPSPLTEIPAASQVDVEVVREMRSDEAPLSQDLRISFRSATNTAQSIPAGDLIYFKNITVSAVGRLFIPVIQPNQSIADAGTNGITGTLATGCNPIMYRPGSYFFADGSDDAAKTPAFSLSQPTNVYAVLKQNSWTAADAFYDGNSAIERMKLGQITSVPTIALYAGSADAANNNGLALQAFAVVGSVFAGASSLLRVNRGAATTGNPGTNPGNGLTISARYDAAQFGNACYRRIVGFDTVAHDADTQLYIAGVLMSNFNIT